MSALFHGSVLSSGRLLRLYLTEDAPSAGQIHRMLFLEERSGNPYWPDHVYRSHWDMSYGTAKDNTGQLVLAALDHIAGACFDIRHARLAIHQDMFAEWQTLITRVSPLLLVTYGLWREFGRDRPLSAPDILPYLREGLVPSTLPVPVNATVDDMIAVEGLYDLHVHLNGTTEADVVRLDALARPMETLRQLKQGYGAQGGAQSVAEQYEQVEEGLTPERLVRRLRMAAYLRRELTDVFCSPGAGVAALPPLRLAVEGGRLLPDGVHQASRRHPVRRFGVPVGMPDTVCEGLFLWRAFDHLAVATPEPLCRAFHLYLLIGNLHQKFVVQQQDQKGFDQFQKITLNEFRSLSERAYERRFDQLARTEAGALAFLEGRFAPKATYAGNHRLVSTIVKGFRRHHDSADTPAGAAPGEGRRLRLGLVAHFIKRPEGRAVRGIARHASLRRDIEIQALALLTLYRRSPALRPFLVGADAAANELHAEPEVFAHVFRRLRHAGWTNFTFHAGEDFRHLLSGMRAVAEAMAFLDMRSGNRIGHATALGVDPVLWARRMGGRLVLQRGAWLDDLVFAYRTLAATPDGQAFLMPLRDAIRRHARHLYGREVATDPDVLGRAWMLRGLDPCLACDPARDQRDAVSAFRRAEWDRIVRARDDDPEAYDLFLAYHSPTVRRAGQEWVEVSHREAQTEMLVLVQQATLAEVIRRDLVLEAMPTSNLRIGIYRDMAEHHLTRWLGLDGALARPKVVLASDDPGIFANSLHGDFCHLLSVLRDRPEVDDGQAMALLRELNRTARTHRFQPPARPLRR